MKWNAKVKAYDGHLHNQVWTWYGNVEAKSKRKAEDAACEAAYAMMADDHEFESTMILSSKVHRSE